MKNSTRQLLTFLSFIGILISLSYVLLLKTGYRMSFDGGPYKNGLVIQKASPKFWTFESPEDLTDWAKVALDPL